MATKAEEVASKLDPKLLKEYQDAFEIFDKDGDGEISAVELDAVLKGIGVELKIEQVEAMIARVDEDQSGTINFGEFLIMMTTNMDPNDPEREFKEAFKMFDLDGDGLIHYSELQIVMGQLGSELTEEQCKKMIEAIDEDGDGKVNYEEFKVLVGKGGAGKIEETPESDNEKGEEGK